MFVPIEGATQAMIALDCVLRSRILSNKWFKIVFGVVLELTGTFYFKTFT